MKDENWYKKSYRRNLVDMHIEDWDERFLSRLDPATYVRMLRIAKVKSAMVYANSHVGYCYWPSKTGHMHRGLKGKNVLGEIIDLCHKEGIDVIVYYSLIYNNWAYEQHPEWRIVDLNGKTSRERLGRAGRYGVCCPNSLEYRKFVMDQIKELCQNYEFEGIFFDMTFWPTICYCSNCKRRYKEEVGANLPTIVDWDDSSWIKFQKKREEWLAEFAAMATSVVKKYKPKVAVEHQSSTVAAPWTYGVTSSLSEQCDYVDGDFYGGVLQQSFICKLYYNLTPNVPFAFSTSICYPGVTDHTSTKPKEAIEARAFLAIAHDGAFLIIDAVDPIGTLEERRYRMIGDIFKEISRYEKYLGGEFCQDVAIYFSFDSKMNFAENGKEASPEALGDLIRKMPHVDAALGIAETLRTNHIPFGVITSKNLKELSHHQVLILPNVLRLSNEETDVIKNYINNGGTVYASKFTLKSGLAEILSASYIGETKEKATYITPNPKGRELLPEVSEGYPLSIMDSQVKAEISSKEGVMATITLPYTDPEDPSKFASIHSNPPGIPTEYPALIYKEFGKGRILWSSAAIEAQTVNSLKHRSVILHIIKWLAQGPFSFEVIAPECVEVTMFHKKEEKRYLINLVNLQSEIGTPDIPVEDILLKVRVPRRRLKVRSIPDGAQIPFKQDHEYTDIKVPRLLMFSMLALDYE